MLSLPDTWLPNMLRVGNLQISLMFSPLVSCSWSWLLHDDRLTEHNLTWTIV